MSLDPKNKREVLAMFLTSLTLDQTPQNRQREFKEGDTHPCSVSMALTGCSTDFLDLRNSGLETKAMETIARVL